MIVDIVMPKMGESITEGTILEWRKKVGDSIDKDDILLEIGTDKVDSEIPSPYGGRIVELLAEPNAVIEVGEPIARVETEKVAGADNGQPVSDDVAEAKDERSTVKQETTNKTKTTEKSAPTKKSKPSRTGKDSRGKSFFTPVVLKIAAEEDIPLSELETLTGSGRGGRVTKKDVLAYLESREAVPAEAPEQPAVTTPSSAKPQEVPATPLTGERVAMDHMRKLIAEHMRNSVDTSAHVYVVTEVDMSHIVNYVEQNGDLFKQREGFRLTYTPFILEATIKALQAFPEMNASLENGTIVYHKHINMGLAVAVEKGLLVPAIFNCEELNFLGLCRKVYDVASRTRNKQISPDELQGSTFSVTNFGVFNVTLGTPIINQPNVGILGVGTIKKRPVVVEHEAGDSIAIRSMMFLSLGFDHRLIDGAGGSRFIDMVRQNLEGLDPRNLL